MLRGTLAYGLQALDQFGKLDIEMAASREK